jgi:hypothetical protein
MNLFFGLIAFWIFGFVALVVLALAQRASIASGVSQVGPVYRSEDGWHEGVKNGVFGIVWKPSRLLLHSPIGGLVIIAVLLALAEKAMKAVQNFLTSTASKVDAPTINKNKMLKEAEEEGLDLHSFVNNKQLINKSRKQQQ